MGVNPHIVQVFFGNEQFGTSKKSKMFGKNPDLFFSKLFFSMMRKYFLMRFFLNLISRSRRIILKGYALGNSLRIEYHENPIWITKPILDGCYMVANVFQSVIFKFRGVGYQFSDFLCDFFFDFRISSFLYNFNCEIFRFFREKIKKKCFFFYFGHGSIF